MAQLPSGRHIAIQATPLFALIDAACVPEAVITRLLQIEAVVDLSPYIDVMFFSEVAEAPAQETAPGGQPIPPGLEPYASGYTLATIREAVSDWPADDQQAFADYIASNRVQDLLSALLEKVIQVKHQLGRDGDFTLRLKALMWETGCHPVQNEDVDDPMYSLFQVGEGGDGGDAV